MLVRLVAIVVGWTVPSSAQTIPGASPRLEAIVDTFKKQSPAERYKQLFDALAASAILTRQLSALADVGDLGGIEIASSQRPRGMFLATVEGKKIVFAADFMPQLAKKRLHDVAHADDILPNNLVFVLGTLASRLMHPISGSPRGLQAMIQVQMSMQALAFIDGWNDVVDGATHENGNRPLTPAQGGSLLLNMRYRSVFIGVKPPAKLDWSLSGKIEPTMNSLQTLGNRIATMNVLDFGIL